MPDIQPHSLQKQGIILFLSQVIAFLLHFGTSFILVRLVDEYDFGVFQQFNLLLTTVIPIAGLTLVSSLYFFYPIADKRDRVSFLFQTYILLLIISVFLCGIIWIYKDESLLFLNFGDLTVVEPWLFFSLGFILISSISDNLFILEKNNLLTALFFPLEKLIYLLFIVSITYFTKDYYGVIVGYFIYSAIKFIGITYYVFQHSFKGYQLKLKFGNIKNQMLYCIPFLFANIIFVFSSKFDKLMINYYITPDKFAIYSVAFLSVPFLTNMLSSINSVTMPRLSEHYSKNELDKVILLYNKLVFTTSSVAIPAIIYFFIMADEIIILLFTDKYVEATLYYRIYLIIFLFAMTSYGLILRAAKKTKMIFWSNTLAGLLTVLLGLLLIPRYNMLGAIITASASIIFPVTFQLIAEIHLLKASIAEFFPIKKIILLMLVSTLAAGILPIIKWTPLPLFPTLIISSIVYFPFIAFLEYRLELTPFKSNIKNTISFFLKKHESV